MKMEQNHGDGEFTRQEFFVCSCGAWQDHIVVEYDRTNLKNFSEEEGEPFYLDDLSLHVQMNHFLPWYKRLARAVLYVFAKDAKWYHWSETMLTKEDAARLRDVLTEFIESPY
jgi:hypothetical protein